MCNLYGRVSVICPNRPPYSALLLLGLRQFVLAFNSYFCAKE